MNSDNFNTAHKQVLNLVKTFAGSHLVYSLYNLTDDEIALVENSLSVSRSDNMIVAVGFNPR